MNDFPERSTLAALTAPALHPVLLPPDRVGLPSSWWGHVPFAHWLTHELKPGLVVELGTHHGVSFSAFCNVVKQEGLPTRCFAIDTWKGDEQAGFYDETVWSNISESVQQKYSAFATLVRSTFEDARASFADGSIDLLHIDGRHDYDSVRADYEAWRPKLSERGVVLFHDIAIFEPSFGVWRLWQEISPHHPSFAFHHSAGLGVLAPGQEPPPFIAALAGLEPSAAAAVRERLASLGERWIVVDERTRFTVTIDTLNRSVLAATAERGELTQALAQKTDELEEALLKAAAFTDLAAARHLLLAEAETEQSALREQLADTHRDAARVRQLLDRVRTSMSWRVTGPYRVAGRLLKRRVAPLLRSRDFKQIARSGAFDASFYLGRAVAPEDVEDTIVGYLSASQDGRPWGEQNPGLPPRRPVPGFHQLAYAAQCAGFDETAGEDPLAHYLRTGRPGGAWTHPVIIAHRPSAAPSGLRILLHAHFHYPDLLGELLGRLAANQSTVELLVTTTSESKAEIIRELLEGWTGVARIEIVENRGRDIGAMLMRFADMASYDVVGHVHGKKSPQQAPTKGGKWRDFLWEHLIGGAFPMVDVMAAAFAADDRLGLLFPEDPNLNHWDLNAALADAMAERLQLPLPLPPHFDFPKGTMFWARPDALRPLVDLGWDWDDFPAEPIPPDGTVLHTIERMIPFAAERAGFSYATVQVPNSWRAAE